MRLYEVLGTMAYEALVTEVQACDADCDRFNKRKKKSVRKKSLAPIRIHTRAFTQQSQNLPVPIDALPTVAISQLDIHKMGQGCGMTLPT